MIRGMRQKEKGERGSGHPNFIVGQNRVSCLITAIQVCLSKVTRLGYSFSTTQMYLQREKAEEKPHGNGVGRAQEGNGVDSHPCFRYAQRRGAWEFEVGWTKRNQTGECDVQKALY
jgi:hypothetical protein